MDWNTGGYPYRKDFVACLFIIVILCIPLAAQNGVTANEATTGITPGSSIDALWADGNDHRWKIAVTNSGSTTFTGDMALWPCTTQTGGIVYSGTPPFSGAVNLETCLSIPSGDLAGVPLLIGSSAPQWGAENLDIQGYAVVVEVTTNATAPSLNKLVVFTGAPTTVTVAGSSTNGIEGICAGSCSATNAQIARWGVVGCSFDNTTTAGHYVQATGSGSQCHDFGASYPTNGNQVLGRVLVSNGTAGQVNNIMLYPPGLPALLTASGNGTNYQTTNATTSTSGHVATYDGSVNTQDSGTALSSLVSGTSGTSNTIPKYTSASAIGNSSITDNGTNVGLTEQVVLKRISVANGTTQSSGNFSLSSGWGTSPSVGSIVGTDQAMSFVVTAGTGTPSAGSTVTITFADGSWTNAPICIEKNEASSSQLLTLKNTTTATTLTITESSPAPTASATYTINVICFGH